MERIAVNPEQWSVQLGFNQAELVEGHRRTLVCSGQDAVDATGATQHPGDMAGQLRLSLDNLERLLSAAGMGLSDVVRLNFYATDMDALLQHFSLVNDRFEGGDTRFAPRCSGLTGCRRPTSSSCSRRLRWTE